jgi:hypothetical protein
LFSSLIVLDLVFGLPVTERGFQGILVMTEVLTKYPYIAPIKSKEAIEIAKHFLKFFLEFLYPIIVIYLNGI